MANNDEFFTKRTPNSEVKANIVTKYFCAWATALKNHVAHRGNKLQYLDLFCGQGYYDDGSHSTPLRVIEAIIRDADLSNIVSTHFNDVKVEHCEKLTSAIASLSGVEHLRYKPNISNVAVDEDAVKAFIRQNSCPTLLFLDPFGYRGVTIDLIWSAIRSWGSDCIFFFNYLRVNAGLPNPYLNSPIDALFSKPIADALREKVKELSVDDREEAIIDAVTSALNAKGGKFVQGFRFRSESEDRTSHFLIFVSKSAFALSLMKDIMAKESTVLESSVPSFELNPAKAKLKKQRDAQMDLGLFDKLPDEIDSLSDNLRKAFSRQTVTVKEIYYSHHPGTNYILKNYRDALLRMESQGKITCIPPIDERPKRNKKGTLGEDVTIIFP